MNRSVKISCYVAVLTSVTCLLPLTFSGASDHKSNAVVGGASNASNSRVAPYLGFVATRTQSPSVRSRDQTKAVSSTYHDTRDDVTALKLAFANWYVDPESPAVEVGAGGPCIFTARIEYPAGTFVDVHFNGGSAQVTAADGATVVSDWTSVRIPAGKRFKVHVRRKGGERYRIVYNSRWGHQPEDTMIFGAQSDSVELGDVFDVGASDAAAPPLAILGMTTKHSMLIIGDSIEFGGGDTHDHTGLFGPAARLLGTRVGYANVSRGSESSSHFIRGHGKRVELAKYATHVVIGHGGNDIAAGSQPADIFRRLKTIRDYFPGKVALTLTEQPRTESTDGWTTASNQNVTKYEGIRQSVQQWKRGSAHPFNHVIDYAATVEAAGKHVWKPGYTNDGVHPTQSGARAILLSSFDLNQFATELAGDVTPPMIISKASFENPRDTSVITSLLSNELGTWSIRGGSDADKFIIDALTGALTLVKASDYKRRSNNERQDDVYRFNVRFTDRAGLFVGQSVTITLVGPE